MILLTQGSNSWLSRVGVHPHSLSGTFCGTLNRFCLLYSLLQFSTEDNCPFSLQQGAAPKCTNWKDTIASWGVMRMVSPHPSQLWGTHLMKVSLLLLYSSTTIPQRSAEAHGAPESRAKSMYKATMVLLYLHQAKNLGVPPWQRCPQNDSSSPNYIYFSPCAKCISVLMFCLSSPCDGNPSCFNQKTTNKTTEAANMNRILS